MEKIKIRGLVRGSGWAFLLWGIMVTLKGIYDALWGEPEANYYSPEPWQFVTKDQWFRYAGFEWAYGMACIGVALLLWRFARRVPDVIERAPAETDSIF